MYAENYGYAIQDCKRAIAIDPENIKAYYRAAKVCPDKNF